MTLHPFVRDPVQPGILVMHRRYPAVFVRSSDLYL